MAVTAEALRSVEVQGESAERRERGPVVLTARDRELLVHLALARCLSAEQIGRLIFAGKTDSIVRRRLCRLASGKYQYVRRLPFRTRDGVRAVAWSLKPLGHMAARNLFAAIPDRPVHDTGAEFLEHEVGLNDLYVALAAAAKRSRRPFDHWPFNWLPSGSARLPWTEFDRERNSPANRLICPDATVELLAAKRRFFIETETGAQALGLHRDGAPGRNAMKAKIDRYTRFVLTPISSLLNNETFYLRAFPDSWPVELLFLVPGAAQRDAIAKYVAGSWRPTNERVTFTIRALTLNEAPAALCRAGQFSVEATCAPKAGAAGTALTPEEIRALYDFYNRAIATIASVRDVARKNPLTAALPEYPANHEAVKEICRRLAATLR